jgi:hypothetical protein
MQAHGGLRMPNRNKQRGYELEREAGEDLEGDIKLGPYTVEAKRKKSGYKFLYDSLDQDGADLLVVRQDRSRRLYLLEEKTLLDLMRRAGLLSEI